MFEHHYLDVNSEKCEVTSIRKPKRERLKLFFIFWIINLEGKKMLAMN